MADPITQTTPRDERLQRLLLQRRAEGRPTQVDLRGLYSGLPVLEPNDRYYIDRWTQINEPSPDYLAFTSACHEDPLSILPHVTSSRPRTPAFLHNGLIIALRAGNIDAARYLISHGAPIARSTADSILSAPADQQIPLFELLLLNGWNPNVPNIIDQYLLPKVISNQPLLHWFQTKAGANPNIGTLAPYIYDFEGLDTNGCCEALEKAASKGHVEAVRLLLDCGANTQNGFPLHWAAGSYENPDIYEGGNSLYNPRPSVVNTSEESETRQKAIMSLLAERGADINQQSRVVMGGLTPGYLLLEAIRVRSIGRTRWLLEHGADPERRGSDGTAIEMARASKNEELIGVVEEGIKARRWMKEGEQAAID